MHFTLLWPHAAMLARDEVRNPGNCILHIANTRVAALLPGDIEAPQERALVATHAAALRADLLLVLHHGSRTSSTEGFLDAAAPREEVFQVGYRNRFGHPQAGVLARYRAHGTRIHRADRDGAIRASSTGGGFEVERCRESKRRYWMGH